MVKFYKTLFAIMFGVFLILTIIAFANDIVHVMLPYLMVNFLFGVILMALVKINENV